VTAGRLYLIDLARLFPPVPSKGNAEYLYNHFRPELLMARDFEFRLSSDAFSPFAGAPGRGLGVCGPAEVAVHAGHGDRDTDAVACNRKGAPRRCRPEVASLSEASAQCRRRSST
jgi:hypothetical protein